MKVPLSWLKDFVKIDLPLEELAKTLTMLGLEVDDIQVVGLPMPAGEKHEFKINGLAWDPEKIVVAQVDEVMPHPNADRLVLCRLKDGRDELVVLTGAPNLFEYKGKGALPKPLKVAYAREGSRIYDGHQPGQVLTTLKRAKIRGVDSFSMVCSEKELGISEEHEGIIILDDDAPTGMPLVDYMGDAVFEISILPNMIRNSCITGIAREIAAATGAPLCQPAQNPLPMNGASVKGQAHIQINTPDLNPRFVLGLVRGVTSQPSPYWVQRRLRLAGMRPINGVVDATNYIMLEVGEPLHAFDYDVLVQRAGGKAPTIITRCAQAGEKLTTLDNVERTLDDFTVLVCDTAGALSLAGVMGGLESEVTNQTRNVLLEGASWNFINVRKTVSSQRLNSEAAYRFSRGVHPELAKHGVLAGLQRIAQWGGGQIAADLVDEYPKPPQDPVVTLSENDVCARLGIELPAKEIAAILGRLGFECKVDGQKVSAKTPPHRLDVGEGIVGKADLIEEIARIYGYDRIPSSRLSDTLPIQRRNPMQEGEERLQDILVRLGWQEIVSYRQTSPERELRLLPPDAPERKETPSYVQLLNPIAPDRSYMRRSLLACVLEALERNIRQAERIALFEIGPVFLPQPDQLLPAEPLRLAMAMTGRRILSAWDQPQSPALDFFDLKGMLEALFDALHIKGVQYEPAAQSSFHPGKCARILLDEVELGFFGELHPLVRAQYDFGNAPVLAVDLNAAVLIKAIPWRHEMRSVAVFPPILEDIAVIVDENLPAGKVADVIQQAGGKLLVNVRLFDIFRGAQIGSDKKSLAYSLAYQSSEQTLTDKDAAQIRQRIVRRLEQDLGAKLRDK